VESVWIEEASGSKVRLAVRLSEPEEPSARPTILYLHGFGSRQDGEKATFFRARALSAGFAFCSFDCRGHGESGGSMHEISLSRNLEDTAAVHRFLIGRGEPRVALFGSSMGGATALWYSAMYPGEIVASIQIAPAIAMLADLGRKLTAEELESWRRTGSHRLESDLVDEEIGWQMVADLERYPIERLAANLGTPSLIFQGQLDSSVEWRDVARFLALTRPGIVDLRLLADGDHRLIDRLPLIWDETLGFLRRFP
jgi:pimeloyl-ACP methyl ester carboxylesterase